MVDVAGARVVAVLTRAPSSGGKTRLFQALGRPPDPRLLTALLLDTIDGAAAPGIVRVISVTPPSACDEVASIVPAGIGVMPQSEGDLGERMRHAFASLFANGAAAVVLIGSDLPAMTSSIVATAFEILERDAGALVLGPAVDGGYYLIGAARLPPVFAGIDWGSDTVLAQTQAAAFVAGLHVSLIDPLADVDTAEDLQRVAKALPASRTAAWPRDGRK